MADGDRVTWSISNKYYDADVTLILRNTATVSSDDVVEAPAVVFVFDSKEVSILNRVAYVSHLTSIK